MRRTGKGMTLIFWGVPLLVASSFGQAPKHRPDPGLVQQRTARRVLAPSAVPSAPRPQVPMTQLPSTPPQVSYQNGMLTIVAQNSSLGDILREVHKSTGAAIEVPPNATERVVAQLGPGPARDVLASLLNGSAFNYVIVGSTSDPASLASVMLSMKPAGGASETVASTYQPPQQYIPSGYIPPQPPAPGMGPGGPVVQQAANDEEADADDKDDEDNADQEQSQGQTENGAVPAQDGSQPNAGPKTPEQILDMIRQRQQVPPGQVPPRITPPNQSPDNQ